MNKIELSVPELKVADNTHQQAIAGKRTHSRAKSFLFAFRGLAQIIRQERNFRLQLLMMCAAVTGAVILHCSASEWLAIVICCGLVLAAEAANSVFEEMTDWIHPEFHVRAGKIKDMAAALPLLASIVAFIAGLVIFLPKIWDILKPLL